MPTKLPMTGWYNPGLLVQTGIRAAISTVFGRFADKREAIAAANAIDPAPADAEFDYSQSFAGRDFWFDYLADTGDGWNSTYAMARLVSMDLAIDGIDLPRGEALILGGDQVYPTATADDYGNRFRYPFETAYAPNGVPRWVDEEGERPDLYAIPGNHDWYDGLNAFFGLFCRRRIAREGELGIDRRGAIIAGRSTRQTRSYFALKLPGDWWLWGADSQLEGYIDQPQIDYFQHAAAHWMDPGSKVILCLADPGWVYADPDDPEKKFRSFSYLERLPGLALDPQTMQPKGHQTKLVLTGDSHHYAHYVESDEDSGEPARHYVVCGGGGAFLHPTHQLDDVRFRYRFPRPGVSGPEGSYEREFLIASKAGTSDRALFPDAKTSRRLTWRNLGFVWLNPKFAGVLALAYLLFNWILDVNARTVGRGTLADALQQGTFGDALSSYAVLLVASPWPVVLMGIALGGYYYFADCPTSTRMRFMMGSLHAFAQFALVTLTIVGIVWWTGGAFGERWEPVLSVVAATLASAVISAFVFGLYLLVALRFFGRHPNEGFSSLRIEGFKSFLRLKIAGDGTLVIYSIGLVKVPKDDGDVLANPALDPHLIEPPFAIR